MLRKLLFYFYFGADFLKSDFLLISFYFNGAFPLQQSTRAHKARRYPFVSPWSFVPGVSVGTRSWQGWRQGRSAVPYSRAWAVGLELLCPGAAAWWVCWLLFLGEVCKRSQKINLLTGDLGTACSECFALAT